ncbi:MAG: hypothetical protein M3Y09_05605 [Actinomycetota bacterium]|nr:hypothetical protein [Actinomycetota bacterium]
MTSLKFELVGLFTTIALRARNRRSLRPQQLGLRRDALTMFQLELVGLFTAGAIFALPIAEAAARRL